MRVRANASPDDEKLQELILFIAKRSESDVRFGATKLNKLLFFSDFLAYVKLGQSITGHVYQRLENGPAPRALVPVRERMLERGLIAIQQRDHFGKMQHVIVALREANLSRFTSNEIAVVTEVLDVLRSKNASAISRLSHEFNGWKLAQDKEDIPYEVALVHLRKPRTGDLQRAGDLAEELESLRKECVPSDHA